MAARKLWRPKFPEAKKPCTSCPFLKDNNEAFGKIVAKLHDAAGKEPPNEFDVAVARFNVQQDGLRSGDLVCHSTVYDDDLEKRPMSEWKQCAGAAEAYRKGD